MRPTIQPLVPRDFQISFLNATLAYCKFLDDSYSRGCDFRYYPGTDEFCISVPRRDDSREADQLELKFSNLAVFLSQLGIKVDKKEKPSFFTLPYANTWLAIKRIDLISVITGVCNPDEKHSDVLFEPWLLERRPKLHSQCTFIKKMSTWSIFRSIFNRSAQSQAVPIHRSFVFHPIFEPKLKNEIMNFVVGPISNRCQTIDIRDKLRTCIIKSCDEYLAHQKNERDKSIFLMFTNADGKDEFEKVAQLKRRIMSVNKEVPTFQFLLDALATYCQPIIFSCSDQRVGNLSFIKFFLDELRRDAEVLAVLDFPEFPSYGLNEKSYRLDCFNILLNRPALTNPLLVLRT